MKINTCKSLPPWGISTYKYIKRDKITIQKESTVDHWYFKALGGFAKINFMKKYFLINIVFNICRNQKKERQIAIHY